MIKRFTGWFLEKLVGLLSYDPGPEDIRRFVQEHFQRFKEDERSKIENQADLTVLQVCMIDLGWLDHRQKVSTPKHEVGEIDQQWLTCLKDKKIFTKGVLQPGSGKYLDMLDEAAQSTEKALTADVLEKLLRHVEIRREKSLGKFTKDITEEQNWIEKFDISILFSRTARRHNDLRFLNAAMKMNEWYMAKLKTSKLDKSMARLLLALAEGEISARELLA